MRYAVYYCGSMHGCVNSNIVFLYPTYDLDQRYRQSNIFHIALWYS